VGGVILETKLVRYPFDMRDAVAFGPGHQPRQRIDKTLPETVRNGRQNRRTLLHSSLEVWNTGPVVQVVDLFIRGEAAMGRIYEVAIAGNFRIVVGRSGRRRNERIFQKGKGVGRVG
jgi:hypothetical protein